MPSTWLHAALPAACAGATLSLTLRRHRLEPRALVRVCLLVAILANGPDLDLIPASFFPANWREIHRAWGHNLFAALLLTGVGAFTLRRWAWPGVRPAVAWSLSAAAVMSHLFLDAATYDSATGEGIGVPLAWPLSSLEWTLPWKWFPATVVASGAHPVLGHVTASDFWTLGAWIEARTLVLGTIAWIGILLLTRLGSRVTERGS